MGIDTFILAKTQIVDEERWQEALAAIEQEFRNESSPYTDDETGQQRPLVERFDDASDLQQPYAVDQLELEEQLNFGAPGTRPSDCYEWETFASFGAESLISAEKEATDKLEQALQLQQATSGSASRGDLKFIQGRVERARFKLERFQRLTDSEKECLSQLEEELLPDVVLRRVRPPTRLQFNVGEGPSLPAFARHFRCCYSKTSGSCLPALPVLSRIYEVLVRFFPEDICIWFDVDDTPDSLALSHFADEASAALDRRCFYEQLRESILASSDRKASLTECMASMRRLAELKQRMEDGVEKEAASKITGGDNRGVGTVATQRSRLGRSRMSATSVLGRSSAHTSASCAGHARSGCRLSGRHAALSALAVHANFHLRPVCCPTLAERSHWTVPSSLRATLMPSAAWSLLGGCSSRKGSLRTCGSLGATMTGSSLRAAASRVGRATGVH